MLERKSYVKLLDADVGYPVYQYDALFDQPDAEPSFVMERPVATLVVLFGIDCDPELTE